MKEIVFSGIVGQNLTPAWFRSQVENTKHSEIKLLINSSGGGIFAGFEIVSTIQKSEKRFIAEITSLCASMASIIACCCDHVIVFPQSTMMLHRSWATVRGNAADMEAEAAILRKLDLQACGIYARKSGKSEAEIMEMLKAESWITGSEIVSEGLADEYQEDGSIQDSAQALINAKALFAANYTPPTFSDIAACAGLNNSNVGCSYPLSADDMEAAKLVGLTPNEYRMYSQPIDEDEAEAMRFGISVFEYRKYKEQK